MKNKLGFTLIELLAVIVILAIIALIATPIILGIIDDAKKESNIRSIEMFKDTINKKVASMYLNPKTGDLSGRYTTTDGKTLVNIDDNTKIITLDYTGDKVICDSIEISKNGIIEVSQCRVGSSNEYVDIKFTDSSCFQFSNGVITDYSNDCSKDVVIPNKIDNQLVTAIGDRAFKSKNLTAVTIPETVKIIGEYAFAFNKLTSVIIPDSVTDLSYDAFQSNKLSSVYISKNITELKAYVFGSNEFSSFVIPDNITKISYGAFYHNKLTSVTIPNSVTEIGPFAFSYNKLTSVTIPSSVKKLDGFSSNFLTNVNISNGVTNIESYAFAYNFLTIVDIPDSVTIIGQEAFSQNQLTTVSIGNSITSIGIDAFSNRTSTYGAPEGVEYTGPNQISSMVINAYQNNVAVSHGAFSGVIGEVCWLKNSPN